MIRCILIFCCLTIVGCTSPTKQITKNGSCVEVIYQNHALQEDCSWIGQATGTEGHWYSYLFFPNKLLIDGAMNDLRNTSVAMGGDTVVLSPPLDFATSVTFHGSVYNCNKLNN